MPKAVIPKSGLLAVFLLVAIIVATDTWSAAANGDTSRNDALRADASAYASRYGVTLDEAAKRLEAQLQAAEMVGSLAALSTVAGVWLEHEPEFRLVAWFVGRTDEPRVLGLISGSAISVEVRYDAEATLTELVAATELLARSIRPEDGVTGVSPVVQSGRVLVELESASLWKSRTAQLAADLSAITGYQIEVTVSDLPAGDDATYGGKPIGSCTTGFTVASVYTGTTGVLTAGHCGSAQPTGTYWETPSTSFSTAWVMEMRDQSRDLEWHTVLGVEYPQFWDGWLLRTVTGSYTRTQQYVGMYVCKYGTATGTSCGTINSNTFAPTYDLACNGVPCAATWIRTYDLTCTGGDSGGPVFIVQTALGLHKGHQGGQCIYMPIEYISSAGVYLLQ
jgi:streptogrisin C